MSLQGSNSYKKDNLQELSNSLIEKKEELVKARKQIKGAPKALKEMEKDLRETLSQSEKQVRAAIDGKYTDVHKGIMERMAVAVKANKEDLKNIRQDRKTLGHEIEKFDPTISKGTKKLETMGRKVGEVLDLNNKSVLSINDKETYNKTDIKIEEKINKSADKILNKDKKDYSGKATEIHNNITTKVLAQNESVQSQTLRIVNLQIKQVAVANAAKQRLLLANEIHKSQMEIDHAIKNNERAMSRSSPNLKDKLKQINVFLNSQKTDLEMLGTELAMKSFDVTEAKNFSSNNEQVAMSNYNRINQDIEALIKTSNDYQALRPAKSSLSREGRVNNLSLKAFANSINSFMYSSVAQIMPQQKTQWENKLNANIQACNIKLEEFAKSALNLLADEPIEKGQSSPGEIYGELEKSIAKLEADPRKGLVAPTIADSILGLRVNFNKFDDIGNTQSIAKAFPMTAAGNRIETKIEKIKTNQGIKSFLPITPKEIEKCENALLKYVLVLGAGGKMELGNDTLSSEDLRRDLENQLSNFEKRSVSKAGSMRIQEMKDDLSIALKSSSTVTSEPDSPGEETSELESSDDLNAIADNSSIQEGRKIENIIDEFVNKIIADSTILNGDGNLEIKEGRKPIPFDEVKIFMKYFDSKLEEYGGLKENDIKMEFHLRNVLDLFHIEFFEKNEKEFIERLLKLEMAKRDVTNE
jgi:hypothetical protein